MNDSICSAKSRFLAVSVTHAANNLKFYISVLTILDTIKWWAWFHKDHKWQISCHVSYVVIFAHLVPCSLCFLCKSQLNLLSIRLCSDISESPLEFFFISVSVNFSKIIELMILVQYFTWASTLILISYLAIFNGSQVQNYGFRCLTWSLALADRCALVMSHQISWLPPACL